jgi:hypothetical protein
MKTRATILPRKHLSLCSRITKLVIFSTLLISLLTKEKVACKTFADSVAITVVGRQLMSNLWEVFTPTSVMDMAPEPLALICEESPGIQKRRERLETKLNGLNGGLEVWQRALKGAKLKWTSMLTILLPCLTSSR